MLRGVHNTWSVVFVSAGCLIHKCRRCRAMVRSVVFICADRVIHKCSRCRAVVKRSRRIRSLISRSLHILHALDFLDSLCLLHIGLGFLPRIALWFRLHSGPGLLLFNLLNRIVRGGSSFARQLRFGDILGFRIFPVFLAWEQINLDGGVVK